MWWLCGSVCQPSNAYENEEAYILLSSPIRPERYVSDFWGMCWTNQHFCYFFSMDKKMKNSGLSINHLYIKHWNQHTLIKPEENEGNTGSKTIQKSSITCQQTLLGKNREIAAEKQMQVSDNINIKSHTMCHWNFVWELKLLGKKSNLYRISNIWYHWPIVRNLVWCLYFPVL